MSNLKLSEIRAGYEGMVARDTGAFYLLDLVERMGQLMWDMEHELPGDPKSLILAEQARALLKELEK